MELHRSTPSSQRAGSLLLLLLPLGCLAANSCDDDATANFYASTLKSLSSKGYTFSPAVLRVTEKDGWGANPGNPYIVYEDVPGSDIDMDVWPLGVADAILLISCTPAGARYFSYRSYLFRGGGDGVVFASMGDSTNNLVLNTSTGHANGARTALVTTGDAITHADISSALAKAGLQNATNLDQVELTLFNGSTASYTMLHRASIWSDESARQEYLARNQTIYYVRAPAGRAQAPLPLSAQRTRGTGQREQDMDGLSTAYDKLKAGVIEHMRELGGTYNDTIPCKNANILGRDCIANDYQCYGDNPDTNYLECASPLGPDNASIPISLKDVYILLGTNCVQTGKCTYSNAGVYYETISSTILTTDDRAWDGSAVAFAPSLPAEMGAQLFATAFSRDCSPYTDTFGPFCVHVSYDQVPQGENWYPVTRTVLEPATRTGPAVDELMMPELLRFSFEARVGPH